jgi:hypothetical protein
MMDRSVQFGIRSLADVSEEVDGHDMPARKRNAPLTLGERARSKLNRRIGTVDAVDDIDGRRQYGLHYDEAPRDEDLTTAGHDGAQLPAELIERE